MGWELGTQRLAKQHMEHGWMWSGQCPSTDNSGWSHWRMQLPNCEWRKAYKYHNSITIHNTSVLEGLQITLEIFNATRIKPEWCEVAPTGYMIWGSANRYINAKLFQEYSKQFVHFVTEKKILTRDQKVLLLLDMHKSHLFNLRFMEFMRGHNVEVCCFPPHCTHVLQPLDDMPSIRGNFYR